MAKRIRPCIKCGQKGSEIKIWDCGYSSFNVGGAKCPCGHSVKLSNLGCFPNDVIINAWNRANPTIKVRIKNLEAYIEKTQGKLDSAIIEVNKLRSEQLRKAMRK